MLVPVTAVASSSQAPRVPPASPPQTCSSPAQQQAEQTLTPGVGTRGLVLGWVLQAHGLYSPPLRKEHCAAWRLAPWPPCSRRTEMTAAAAGRLGGKDGSVSRSWCWDRGDTRKAPQKEPASAGPCTRAGGSTRSPLLYLGYWVGCGETAAGLRVSGNRCSPGSSCAPAQRPRWDSGPSCSSRTLHGILSAAPGEEGEVRAQLRQPHSAGPSNSSSSCSPSIVLRLVPARSFWPPRTQPQPSRTLPSSPRGCSNPVCPGTFPQTRLWHGKEEV